MDFNHCEIPKLYKWKERENNNTNQESDDNDKGFDKREPLGMKDDNNGKRKGKGKKRKQLRITRHETSLSRGRMKRDNTKNNCCEPQKKIGKGEKLLTIINNEKEHREKSTTTNTKQITIQ